MRGARSPSSSPISSSWTSKCRAAAGIELLQQIDEPIPYVIFVTAHPEFALPAFEVHAADYLVKPVQRQRFVGSVMRAKQRIAERRVAGLARQIAGAVGGNGSRRGTRPRRPCLRRNMPTR